MNCPAHGLYALMLILCTTGLAFSQFPGVTISAGTQISADNASNPHAESFLAINPKDQKNWLATAIVVENGGSFSYPYYTRDGGKTWQRGRLNGENTGIFKGGDPIVYFDPSGAAFFGTLESTPIGWLMSRSIDGGQTWEDPITIPGGTYDRQYVAFDSTGGKFNGRMYAGGCISVAEANGKRHNTIDIVHSEDGGRTFSAGKLLSAIHGDEEMFVMTDLLVASDGKLVIPFSTYVIPSESESRKDAPLLGHLWTAVSEDGGITFLPAVKGPTRSRGHGMRALLSDAAPRAAIDTSQGPHRDRIYLTWADFDGEKYVVKVSHSSDLGKKWSTPLVVNDNTNAGEPANPTIAVNKDGIVAVTFNDRRDDPKGSCYRLYFAFSLDGGETFGPNVKASEKPTCPLGEGNWKLMAASFLDLPIDLSTEKRRPAISIGGVPTRWPNGGDTQGLLADDDGTFHAAWLNGETGVMQLWSKDFSIDRAAALQSAQAVTRKDLSGDLTIDVSDPIVDFKAHTLVVKVRLENKLPMPVDGPFSIVLDDVESSLKEMQVVNADNKMPRKGASWDIPANSNRLAPNQKSDEKMFEWKFTGGPPDEPREVLRAHFKILGPPQAQAGITAAKERTSP